MVFVFETKVVAEAADVNGSVSVASLVGDAFVLFWAVDELDRAKFGGRFLFRALCSREILRRKRFGLKPRERASSVGSKISSSLLKGLVDDPEDKFSAVLCWGLLGPTAVGSSVLFDGLAIAIPAGSEDAVGAKIDITNASTRTVAMVKDQAA